MKILKFTKPYRLKDFKFSLLISVLALTCLGIMVIGSAKQSVQGRQIIGLVIGLIALAVVSMIDYVWILNLQWILYGLTIAMLLAVRFFGKDVNGATRWIDFGFTTFQPSELAKILLVLFFAKYIMNHEDEITKPVTIIKAVLLMAAPCFLIYKQPDLSTTISIVLVFCVMMYVGGLGYKFIGIFLLITVPAAVILLSLIVHSDIDILQGYQETRILAWLQPEKYSSDEAYQQNNSIMAIGSGRLTGKGLNNNTTTSVKNGNFILEPQTDFIFAIVGEELGFVGCCIVIGLLLLIVIQCMRIGMRAPDTGGRIICCGVAAQIGIQSFINISVATGLFPNTGIPLPFVSYGMSSLVSMFIGIGLVLNVGLQQKKYK
ncbi:rod shape-determining protein RodA [Ruminococcus sp. OM05-10BH]|uniref:Probable peptidoglycan glycosyltransferase FtsW n=1 Tax=Sellimonas catena TaxID=2994035 RepID=A0A9W6C8X3_9FIRM|nr:MULTISPECIES: FtsW/RodA/SpoVE family cell cycle protein [Clostridia]OUQ43067.1 rod shape-determining protein RodA [Drancourtella sp. An12]RHV31584.1 rod shape-determining protein RodA [Ruminococcus sp. OM05-10BH]GLG05308.1 rod shape-determining protein RodA [Sellimonas catena]GLG89988.1 rod shape-determining protein RodA [Sellimonas catena]